MRPACSGLTETQMFESPVRESRFTTPFERAVVRFRYGGASGEGFPQTLMATAARFGLSVPEVALIERKVLRRKTGPPTPEQMAKFHEKVSLLWAMSCQ